MLLMPHSFGRVDAYERRYLQCYQPNKVAKITTHSLVKHCVTCKRVF